MIALLAAAFAGTPRTESQASATPWTATCAEGTLRIAEGPDARCSVPLRILEGGSRRRPKAAVSTDGRWAAVAEDGNLILVDVGRCVPVAVGERLPDRFEYGALLRNSDRGRTAIRFEGTELVEDTDLGRVTWSLPDLRPSAIRGSTIVTDLADGGAFPSLIGLRELRPLNGSPPTPLFQEVRGTGDGALTLDGASWKHVDPEGRVLASGKATALTALQRVSRAGAGLIATDGQRWYDFDRDRAIPEPPAALRPSFGSGDADRYAAIDVPDGMRVVGDGQALGVTIPARGASAAVTPDGSILVTLERDRWAAWEVATGKTRWTKTFPPERTDDGVTALRVGARYVAMGMAGLWMLLDPADGDHLGSVTTGPIIEVPPGRILDEGDTWPDWLSALEAPRPERTSWSPVEAHRLAAWTDGYVQARACGSIQTGLVEKIVEFDASQCRDTHALGDAVAVAEPGGGWRWTARGAIQQLVPMGDHALVRTDHEAGVLGPAGQLRWSRGDVTRAHLLGSWILLETKGAVRVVNAWSGRERWNRPAAELELVDEDRVWVRPVTHAPAVALSFATGLPVVHPGPRPGQAFGWTCGHEGCAQSKPPSTPAAADPKITWTKQGRSVLAVGPGVQAPPSPASSSLADAVVDPAADEVLHVEAGGDTLTFDARTGRLVRRERRRGVGPYAPLAGAPKVTAGPEGVVARDPVTEKARWQRPDLVDGRLTSIDGWPVWSTTGWTVLDPVSGKAVASGEGELRHLAGTADALRPVVRRADGHDAIRDRTGRELRVLFGELHSLAVGPGGELAWIESAGSRRMACADVGEWCVTVPERAEGLVWAVGRVVVPIGGVIAAIEAATGRVAWAAPVHDLRRLRR